MRQSTAQRNKPGALLLIGIILFSGLYACTAPFASPDPVLPIARSEAIPPDAVKQSPETDPTPPILHHPDWLEPVPMPGLINTPGSEDSPFITPDGTQFFFFFTPDSSIPAEQQLNDGSTGIYYSSRSSPDSAWGEPVFLLLADSGESALNGCPTLHEQTLWFCSARSGNYRPIDFYTTDFLNGAAANRENAGDILNQQIGIGELHLSADGQAIYFHAELPGGVGGYDIWVTRQSAGVWQAPENVSAVNSPEMDGWPFLSLDGSELWFSRTFEGSPAIFRSLWNGESWGEPELIVSQFAGEPALDAAGNLFFVHHFIENGVILEADIYIAKRKTP
ncbi:MAG: PD40 domain-containing protein [Anaerolineales bacterium]|nr:PD40 domain-containing protein [Anaerolineales bacterium]